MQIYIEQILGFVNWAMSRSAKYLTLEICNVTMTPFRLIDDDNLKTTLMGLLQSGSASLSSVYASFGMDYDEELSKMRDDSISKAANDIKTKSGVDKAVFMASKETADKFDREDDYKTALTKAQAYMEQLLQASPDAQRQGMNQLQVEDHAMYLMVSRLMEEYMSNPQGQPGQPGATDGTQGQSGQDTNQDQSPTPTNKQPQQ
jgi:hypothetical protein